MYYSQALQDQFVSNLLGTKSGYYIDIGSAHASNTNNTYYFDQLGWKGICVEIDPKYNEGYKTRTCNYINANALDIDYKDLFQASNTPMHIDYLSLDVDELSTSVLKLLPLQEYRFKIITIEHDAYIYGDIYCKQQREILSALGYKLYASNVKVPKDNHGSHLPNIGFEDWWLDSENAVTYDSLYPEEVLSTL
jgi:hypothetical protein